MRKIILLIACVVTAIIANAQIPPFEWARSIGNSGGDMFANDIAVDASGNVYTTGFFLNTADFDPDSTTSFTLTSSGANDIFISKLDVNGKFVWAKKMGGLLDNIANSIAIDLSGNVYITGSTQGTSDFDPGSNTFNLTSAGNNDIFIAKLDANGNFAWAKSIGASANDVGQSIALDASGNVYTTGGFYASIDFNPGAGVFNLVSAGYNDIFILKLDASGNFGWAKIIGGSQFDVATSISLDKSGNIYTTGSYYNTVDFDPGVATFNMTSVNYQDIFVSKLDASGNFVWAKSMGGTLYDYGFSIFVDASGNVYTSGSFQNTVDFDPGAGTYNLTSFPSSNLFISKLDASGNFLWARRIGNEESISVIASAVDGLGNVYTTGDFQSVVDFDPGTDTFNLSPQLDVSMFLSKLDANGNFAGAISFKSPNSSTTANSIGYSVAVDGSNNVYITGWFGGDYDFNPGPGTYHLSSYGQQDVYIVKFGKQSSGIGSNDLTNAFTLYPNPNSGLFNVVFSKPIDHVSIEIFNSLGVLVYQQSGKDKLNTIDLTKHASGLYIVKVMDDKQVIATQKIVKQ